MKIHSFNLGASPQTPRIFRFKGQTHSYIERELTEVYQSAPMTSTPVAALRLHPCRALSSAQATDHYRQLKIFFKKIFENKQYLNIISTKNKKTDYTLSNRVFTPVNGDHLKWNYKRRPLVRQL